MAKKKNINDMLNDYADLLGEDLSNIEAAKVEEDPTANDPEFQALQ